MTSSGWPWEANDEAAADPTSSKIPQGPTVQTENLYRPPSAASAPASTEPDQDATIEPMSVAATGVIPPSAEPAPPMVRESGWRASIVFAFIFVITAGIGFLDMSLHREFTYWTGAAFVLTCLVAAIKVRPRDLWTAVIIPPIAYLLALLVSGQPTTLPGSGSLLLREVSLVATGLAFNAPYIYGGTLLALIVVLIRRPRIKKRQLSAT